jgi:PAS domain S-box-containing protein
VTSANSGRDGAKNSEDLNKIIDAIPVMAWSTLPDGTADFFNEHFLSFLGITAEAAHGWGWTASLHPDDLENLTSVWATLITSKLPGETEARLMRSDGQYRWFLFRANPVYAADGSVTRWYGTNTDIDDRRYSGPRRPTASRAIQEPSSPPSS